jgi:hypothetical protein
MAGIRGFGREVMGSWRRTRLAVAYLAANILLAGAKRRSEFLTAPSARSGMTMTTVLEALNPS